MSIEMEGHYGEDTKISTAITPKKSVFVTSNMYQILEARLVHAMYEVILIVSNHTSIYRPKRQGRSTISVILGDYM